MGGKTDQWGLNTTKDSSMPDSSLGTLHFELPFKLVTIHLKGEYIITSQYMKNRERIASRQSGNQ